MRVATAVVASVIGLLFMVVDLMGAISELGTGTDFVDPPFVEQIIIVTVVFTCVSNALECFIQDSIMPIVTGLLINFALLLIGRTLTKMAQSLGCLLGLITLLFVPLITLAIHAAILQKFLQHCGPNCYAALSKSLLMSRFVHWLNHFALF